jgi:lipoprotein-anchoring transpeptidase ErfK/SrfK
LGARALYLYQNGHDTQFRIHGTPQPWTIGQSFSSGCIRLINEHIEELYNVVPIGTQVFVS